MTINEVITSNEKYAPEKWWPHYAYHYTDIRNAVSIIKCGYLYSRSKAYSDGMMVNDNASSKVIDITNSLVKEFVRFYFRPLTPTQYHNEGYKHRDIRYDQDNNANVPVPIFFLFDLEKLLQHSDTFVSPKSLALNSAEFITSDSELFSKLPFEKIYHNYPTKDSEIKRFRQAEIVCLNQIQIDGILSYIARRNEIEKISFLCELNAISRDLYNKYEKRVYVINHNMFYNNGMYIEDCLYNQGKLSLVYSDTYEKRKYVEKSGISQLAPINADIEIAYFNGEQMVDLTRQQFEVGYFDSKSEFIGINPDERVTRLRIKVYFEKDLMCSFFIHV